MTSACPLYDPQMEHGSCGVGAVIDLRGQATHRTVSDALTIVERLAHRAGSDATGTTGDGVGILTRLPHALLCPLGGRGGRFPRRGRRIRAWACSSCRTTASPRTTRAAFSIRWRRRRGCACFAGATCPAARSCWAPRRGAPCPASASASSPGPRTPPPGKRSTAASTSFAASLKSSRPAPMSAPSPAAPSSTRA